MTSSGGTSEAPVQVSSRDGNSKEASSNGVRPFRLALVVLLMWFIMSVTLRLESWSKE